MIDCARVRGIIVSPVDVGILPETHVVRPKPLAGLRILDLTRLLPGPMCTVHLADMGADVIKVEDPGSGDYGRTLGAPAPDGQGTLFRLVNRNKRSLKLDLSRRQGREVFLDLAATADALVEGFRPGVMARLGVGYDVLHAAHPRLVYCSLTGYGQDGPYRARAGHDIDYCAYAGILEQAGCAGGPPALGNFQIADLAGGALSAALGVVAALLEVQRGGAGRHVDVSMTDCALAHAVVPFATWLDEGATRPRGGDMLTGGLPCYGIYETRDGRHMALGALEHKFWRAFCEAVGRPDLADQHLVSGAQAEAVRAEVATIFKSDTQARWAERLAQVDCCAAPVLSVGEAMADPQLRARGAFVTTEEGGRPFTQLAFPVKLSEFEFTVERPAPRLGEHGVEILAELGYAEDRIEALQREGII